MTSHALWAAVLAIAACSSANPGISDAPPVDGPAAPSPVAAIGAGSKVLWVGAHPDDESTVAPLLAELCIRRKAACHFLVMTRGEGGSCGLAGGCAPDLGTFRSTEMATSAAIYAATLTQWDLANGPANTPEDTLAAWTAASGGTDQLVQRMADALRAIEPVLVITFDPRHGNSCHPDHRATGEVVLAAAQQIPLDKAAILLAESKAIGPAGTLTDGASIEAAAWIGYAPYTSDDPAVWTFDGAATLATSPPRSGWSYLVDTLAAHASQFTDGDRQKFAAATATAQGTALLRLDQATAADPRYACPLR